MNWIACGLRELTTRSSTNPVEGKSDGVAACQSASTAAAGEAWASTAELAQQAGNTMIAILARCQQAEELIAQAKAAGVPIIVAVNKIDKENADPQRVLSELAEHELVPEIWGGDTIVVEMSALENLGIDDLPASREELPTGVGD